MIYLGSVTILEVLPVKFGGEFSGGGERFPTLFANRLGVEEQVITCHSQLGKVTNNKKEFTVPAHFWKIHPFLNPNNPIPSLKNTAQISKFLKQNSKDIEFIHVHNLRTAMSTTWSILMKLVKDLHSVNILTDHGAIFFPLPKVPLSVFDYYAPVSKFSNNILQSIIPKPFFVTPTAVADDFTKEFKIQNFHDRGIDLLFVGRIAPWKRVESLILIAEHLLKENQGIDSKIVIAGRVVDDGYLSFLKSEIKKRNLERNIDLIFNPSSLITTMTS